MPPIHYSLSSLRETAASAPPPRPPLRHGPAPAVAAGVPRPPRASSTAGLHRGPPPLCVVPLNLLCVVFCSAPLLCRPPSGSSAVSPTLRLQPSGNLQFLSYPTPSFLQFINCDVVCACALLCCAYCLCSGLWCECVICIYFVLCSACASEPVNVPIYLCLSA